MVEIVLYSEVHYFDGSAEYWCTKDFVFFAEAKILDNNIYINCQNIPALTYDPVELDDRYGCC